jgi:hypothetical protein
MLLRIPGTAKAADCEWISSVDVLSRAAVALAMSSVRKVGSFCGEVSENTAEIEF